MDDCIHSYEEVSSTNKKSDSDADNVPVSVSEEEVAQMESEDEEKGSKAAPTPTIEGEVPCVSLPVDEEDNDDDDNEDDVNDDDKEDDVDDDDDEEDDDGDDEEDNDDDDEEDVCNFDLNEVEGMSEYKVLRLQKIHRNNVKLASLCLLGGMMSAAPPSADRPNRKKRVVMQGDFVRRVQPKCNVFKLTYKDLDDPVISKRMRSIDSSDTGEEDTVSKRMDEANAHHHHQGDRQYQSVEFYKAKKRLIDRYEKVSGGIKADISPDLLPLPQEMKKQKNNYVGRFAGHYPMPLQDGESYTDKNGCATAFTTCLYKNTFYSGLPPDKHLIFGQMFDYFTDCTLGQVPFLVDGEKYCHNKHFLKGKLTDDAKGSSGGICGSMSSATSSLMRSTGNL